jgi:uncharacterized protein YkvS
LAAEVRLVSIGHVGGIPEVPNGYSGTVERKERAAKEGKDAHAGLY